MREYELYEAKEESPEEELKRADHLIFVSLKVSRTCDVMRNAIRRLINSFEYGFDVYLNYFLRKGKIKEIPRSKQQRALLVKGLMGTSMNKYFSLYNKLVKVHKAEYCAVDEYRKGLTLRTTGKKSIEVNTRDLGEYLERTKEFVKFIRSKTG